MRLGEYGVTIRVSVGYDISGANTLELEITPPVGAKKTFTATLGTIDISADGVAFSMNEYMEYVFLQNNIDEGGSHMVQAIATWDAPAKRLISPPVFFTVEKP